MTLRPATLADLSAQLAAAHAARSPITAVDLAALAAVREYTPEDMTITAEGGLTLAALQATLAPHGQWLPIDPPNPATVTIHQLLSENLFGPRRCGFGTIREHLIGLEAVLPDGRVTHSGGRVVKNVAGYDVLKLFVGARDSLGIISAATFKLRPLPEQETHLTATFPTLEAAWAAVETLLASPLTPVSLDLHNLPAAKGDVYKESRKAGEATAPCADDSPPPQESRGDVYKESRKAGEATAPNPFLPSCLPDKNPPVSLDLHNLPAANGEVYKESRKAGEATAPSPLLPSCPPYKNPSSTTYTLIIGLAGTRAEVAWQLPRAGDFQSPPPPAEVGRVCPQRAAEPSEHQTGALGQTRPTQVPRAGDFQSPPLPLDHEQRFWSSSDPVQTLSVLPSALPAAIARLGQAPFLARVANGILHHRGPADTTPPPPPSALARRLKDTFDPHHILPAIPV